MQAERSASIMLQFRPMKMVAVILSVVPLWSAGPTDTELRGNLVLSNYSCAFSPLTTVPLLFVNYDIRNSNAINLYDVALKFQIEYQDVSGSRTTFQGEAEVPQVLETFFKKGREQAVTLTGDRSNYTVIGCKVWLHGFKKEVLTTKKRTVSVKTGDKLVVAPDCRDDYAKMQAMKPGVEKREFAARLVRVGCIKAEAVYSPKIEQYNDLERVWVDYGSRAN